MEDEDKKQENEDSEQSESNENTEQSEEFDSEIQIPDNIDINLNETPFEEESSVSENTEENLDEGEMDFENSDFVPSSRFNSRATINPFLEQSIEPVENLERDLQGVSGTRFAQTGNQPEVQNAPQYSPSSGDYTGKNYEQPADDTYPKLIRPAPSGLSSSIGSNETMGWRNQENSNQADSGYPREEQNYRFASGASESSKKRRDVL